MRMHAHCLGHTVVLSKKEAQKCGQQHPGAREQAGMTTGVGLRVGSVGEHEGQGVGHS